MQADSPEDNDQFPPLPGFGQAADESSPEPALGGDIVPDMDASDFEELPLPDLVGRIADAVGADEAGSGGGALGPDPLAGSPPPVAEAEPAPEGGQSKKPDPFIGRQFAGYTITDPIGQGGMGMVYKAIQASLDRVVAIKMLNKALVDNEEFIVRFQREARAMANVHHPNIVSVIDFGEQDGTYYMVAEFVEGTNLSKMIRERLMVPPEDLVPIVVQVLSGLDYVAKTGVVHRDIKPDNILIDKDGAAKVADFGLAKDTSKDDTDLTAAGSAMGTPSYMSPEQCMGRPLDVRSDVYALGVTAYYALTGEKPFVGQSSFEIMMKQREHVPPSVHQINPQVSKPLSAIVMKMLEKDPDRRYESAEDCRDAWMTLGQEYGYLGQVTRSGEYIFVDPGKAGGEPASSSGSSDQHDNADLGLAPPPPLPPSAAVSYPSTEDASKPEIDSIDPAIAELLDERGDDEQPSSNAPGRERSSGRRPSERVRRSRAVAVGRQSDADRLFRQGNFTESAAMYSRLAEETEDRRLRSILRTKEREARNKLDDGKANELEKRLSGLIEQGHLDEALKAVRRAQQETQSSGAGQRLADEARRIKTLMARRKRRKMMLIMLVLLVLVCGVCWLLFQEQIMEHISLLQDGIGSTESGP